MVPVSRIDVDVAAAWAVGLGARWCPGAFPNVGETDPAEALRAAVLPVLARTAKVMSSRLPAYGVQVPASAAAAVFPWLCFCADSAGVPDVDADPARLVQAFGTKVPSGPDALRCRWLACLRSTLSDRGVGWLYAGPDPPPGFDVVEDERGAAVVERGVFSDYDLYRRSAISAAVAASTAADRRAGVAAPAPLDLALVFENHFTEFVSGGSPSVSGGGAR